MAASCSDRFVEVAARMHGTVEVMDCPKTLVSQALGSQGG
jgi:hypothetical protein